MDKTTEPRVHTFEINCKSRRYGIMTILSVAENFYIAFQNVRKFYPEIFASDIISVNMKKYHEVICS